MKHLSDPRFSRVFFCWPSRLGVVSLFALAAMTTLDKVAPSII